jgi:hypothetical protein
MSPPRSPRLGARVESRVCDREGYTPTETDRSWCDAISSGGIPVEIKGAMRERSNGSEGRFRIFREPHRQLAAKDGIYAFAVYRARGTGAEILDLTTKRARALRSLDWSSSNHSTPGRDQQVKLRISEVVR